jgi:hypothetical protein
LPVYAQLIGRDLDAGEVKVVAQVGSSAVAWRWRVTPDGAPSTLGWIPGITRSGWIARIDRGYGNWFKLKKPQARWREWLRPLTDVAGCQVPKGVSSLHLKA